MLKDKRDKYTVEIRNKDRNDLFRARKELWETQIPYVDVQSYREIYMRYLMKKDDMAPLQQMKELYQQSKPVYKVLWENFEHSKEFFSQVLEQLTHTESVEERHLTSYHLNNMVFYGTTSIPNLNVLLQTLDRELDHSMGRGDPETASNILYTLANLYGDEEVSRSTQMVEVIPNLVDRLSRICTAGQTLTFNNGVLWVLRNLIYQQSSYDGTGRLSLQVCELLWPSLLLQMNEGDVGFQLGEDLLYVVGHVAKNCNDEEINLFFENHIGLMIAVITHQWPHEQYNNVSYTLKYIAMGPDEVVEQMLELGVLELMQALLATPNESTLETLGFMLHDEAERVVDALPGVLHQLVGLLGGALAEEALHTLCVLVKGTSAYNTELVQMGVVESLLDLLKSNDMQLDILEMLLELLRAESEEEVKQMVLTLGGGVLLTKCMTSENVLVVQLAEQVEEFLY